MKHQIWTVFIIGVEQFVLPKDLDLQRFSIIDTFETCHRINFTCQANNDALIVTTPKYFARPPYYFSSSSFSLLKL
jgi:hypothetical protein